MRRRPRLILAFAFGLSLAWVGGAAVPARALSPVTPSLDRTKVSQARAAFKRGIELYKERDFDAALVELKRAYALVPSIKILYDLGQVSYQRHDYAGALRYFRRYLTEGDGEIAPDRQREVAEDIGRLEMRFGRLEVQTLDEGAQVLVDDVVVGKTPLVTLIPVSSGARRISLVARTGEQRTRLVKVAGGEIVRVYFPRFDAKIAAPGSASAKAPPRALATAPAPRTSAAATDAPPPAAALAVPVAEPAHITTSLPIPAPPTFAPADPPLTAAPASPMTEEPALSLAAAPPPPPPRTRGHSSSIWRSWAVTGVLAAGAATTGVLALLSKHDLDAQLVMFPPRDADVDYYDRRTRGFALATDGLLIGASIMTAISFYLTYRDPK